MAKGAIADAGLVIDSTNGPRVGVICGTALGPAEVAEEFYRDVWKDGPSAANPALFPNIVHNAAGGHVSIHTGAVGVASTVCTGHAAGAAAVCYAHDLLSSDRADAVICLAADVLTDTVCDGYGALGMFSSDAPEACLSETAVGLVLEREGSARARGARLYGAIAGYGIASDALGIGRSDARGAGLERAMRTALDRSGRRGVDVEAVWAGSFGQRVLDRAEARAIRRALPHASQVFKPKLFLGEPVGAGGPMGVSLAMHRWQNGDAAIPGLAIVNSSSLGGVHFSIALEPPAAV
jgi:3-oxoacyl-[acyl-carrier-protein] synthase II